MQPATAACMRVRRCCRLKLRHHPLFEHLEAAAQPLRLREVRVAVCDGVCDVTASGAASGAACTRLEGAGSVQRRAAHGEHGGAGGASEDDGSEGVAPRERGEEQRTASSREWGGMCGRACGGMGGRWLHACARSFVRATEPCGS